MIWARLDEGKCGFRNLLFVQIFAVKLCSRILHKCRKILGICWLWKEQCRMSSGCLLVDPNGQNVGLCTRDFQ